MKLTTTEVLNKLENDLVEKAVSKVKKEFAEKRKNKSEEIRVTINTMTPMFGYHATARAIFNAQMAAGRARIDLHSGDGRDVLSATLKGGLLGFLEGAAKMADEKMTDGELTTFVLELLSPAAKTVFLRGATLGEMFEVQPDLFL